MVAKEGSNKAKFYLFRILRHGLFRVVKDPEIIISGELKTQLEVEIEILIDDFPEEVREELDTIRGAEILHFDFNDKIVKIPELGLVSLVSANYIGKKGSYYHFLLKYEV